MKKWTQLDEAEMPGGEILSLVERDGVYTIRLNGTDLMSTRRHNSEEELAVVACAHLKARRGAAVLIGGLGLGFTLRATLGAVPRDAKVIVAELIPKVVAWNANPAFPFAAREMKDRRVKVVQKDVGAVIARSPGAFDSILIDVDNSPSALSAESNKSLYSRAGLESARAALKPDGCLGVWSAVEDPLFAKLMGKAGFSVEVKRSRSHSTSGGWHTLFLGRLGTKRGQWKRKKRTARPT